MAFSGSGTSAGTSPSTSRRFSDRAGSILLMRSDLLHVYTARYNPLRYEQPQQHFKDWVEHMLDCGVRVHVAEVQYGERPFECDQPHVDHVGLRANTPAWAKENALNIALWRNNHH